METRTATVDKNAAVSQAVNVSGVIRSIVWCITFVFGLIVGWNQGYQRGERQTKKEYESALDQWSKAYEDQRNYTKEYKRLLDNELRKR